MKTVAFFLLLFNSTVQGTGADWGEVETALKAYVNYPSSENANRVTNALPKEHAPWGESSPSSPASQYIYEGHRFSMLEHQVGAAHVESVRLAFRLFSISDGGFTEDLQIVLGKLIRPSPKLFLEELDRSAISNSYYDGLLMSNGYALVDRREAQCLEAENKIEALNSVTDSKLSNIKQTAISIIEKHRSQYC